MRVLVAVDFARIAIQLCVERVARPDGVVKVSEEEFDERFGRVESAAPQRAHVDRAIPLGHVLHKRVSNVADREQLRARVGGRRRIDRTKVVGESKDGFIDDRRRVCSVARARRRRRVPRDASRAIVELTLRREQAPRRRRGSTAATRGR